MRTSLVVLMVAAVGCGGDEAEPTFVAWGSSTTSVTLRWEPVDGAVGYLLEREGRDGVVLEATDLGYYDRNLAAGSYSYRLTALSPDAKVQETSATTSEDPAIITVEDPPLGAPVVATIGSAGGTIELVGGEVRAVVPPGALPDGATVTLQAIASPAGEEGLAVEVSSDIAFAAPVDVSFAIQDGDVGNAIVAEKQDDGTWVTIEGRYEADRAVVATTDELSTSMIAPKLARKLVKLRKLVIQPHDLKVKANAKKMLTARAYFSDNACTPTEEEPYKGLFGPCTDFGGWYGGDPIVDQPVIKNGQGRWALGGPGTLSSLTNGTTTYTAPGSKPTQNNWPVTFTRKGITATGYIHFLGSKFKIEFAYDNSEEIVAACLSAQVRDKFDAHIELGDGASVAVVHGPYNESTTVTNETPLAGWQSGTRTSYMDIVHIDSFTCTYFKDFASLECMAAGTNAVSSATCTDFSDPPKMTMTQSSSSTFTLFFSLNGFVPDEIVGDDKLFPIEGTNWRAFVTPLAVDE